MSAYNTLSLVESCPKCGEKVSLVFQFKFGDTWQYQYDVGQKLRWRGNDYGHPNLASVLIDAVSEECPNCHKESDFIILTENDEIKRVVPNEGSGST